MSDDGHTASTHDDATRRASEEGAPQTAFRLPPPAFPPGARRREVARDLAAVPSGLGGAFISPDDPMPPRSQVPTDEADLEDGVVTGIGDGPLVDPTEPAATGDPYVADLVERVSELAEALKRRGEAALRTGPEMSRFEVTLRAYCVGYLAGRRGADQEG